MEFTLWEIPGFMILGALGGLIGAYFNVANEHLTEWRRHNISTRVQRYVEVICIASFVAILAFGIPAAAGGACTTTPSATTGHRNQCRRD